jgi:hypothetical protein
MGACPDPATILELCEDEPRDLCQRFAPAFAQQFTETLEEAETLAEATLRTGGAPVLLTTEIDAAQGGFIRIGVRATDSGQAAAELTIDAATGVVRLDYTRGPVFPLARPPVLQGTIPPSATVEIELVLDGAAVFGTVNGRPLAFLAFSDGVVRDQVTLAAEEGAQIASLRLNAVE